MLARRFDAIDALRGIAIVWMTLFHFCFDLDYFGFVRQDFYRDSFWTTQRTCIVSLFLFCAGMGQAMALHQGQDWKRFWRRWGQIAACALLVTAGSWLLFPRSFIYFGVLHGLAVMLLVARATVHWGAWLWPLGALAIASKPVAATLLAGTPAAAWFDSGWLNWLGWITRKPITEDYVPVFPWLGVLWWGVASGRWLAAHRPQWLDWRPPRPGHALALLGRWSLSYYLLHQPVLLGLLALLRYSILALERSSS